MERLAAWDTLDTALAGTAAICSVACALPGALLMLRRQSMMADALSHTALPGVVFAFLFAHTLNEGDWISEEAYPAVQWTLLFAGAVACGVLTAWLTEAVRRLGRVEAGAALGVVYTTLFALGLFVLRWQADAVHIEPDCVLFGEVEQTVLNIAFSLSLPWGGVQDVPVAFVSGAAVALSSALLIRLFWKELLVSTFDPGLAAAVGVNPRRVNDALMAATAIALVTVFQSVGSILAVAMLVTPAAAARCCTDRLGPLLGLAAIFAALSAFLGHALSITAVPALAGSIGLTKVTDAGTAGLTAFTAGMIFCGCALFGPAQGVLVRRWRAKG
ncbi:metal ABC transporter permease [Alienimonas chondri]|uniref:Manganese transport system membrane protein MntB n=1 Tax=Alienimonas chondri TaxID=2681879 RepID=A0ABX1VIH8_9PLAN|nr:metal ABC transporter permease [Alienimonas chondri]NNJ27693.1 Manganese transport system membrane protein MntB [Alienimonas chondri]